MLWVTITLMVSMAVSLLLEGADMDSTGNRVASLAVRGFTLFICLMAILSEYAS